MQCVLSASQDDRQTWTCDGMSGRQSQTRQVCFRHASDANVAAADPAQCLRDGFTEALTKGVAHVPVLVQQHQYTLSKALEAVCHCSNMQSSTHIALTVIHRCGQV